LQKSVLATAPVPLFPFRGPPSTSRIETFRDGEFRSERSAVRLSLANDGWARRGAPTTQVAALVEQGLFGAELRERLFSEVSRQLDPAVRSRSYAQRLRRGRAGAGGTGFLRADRGHERGFATFTESPISDVRAEFSPPP